MAFDQFGSPQGTAKLPRTQRNGCLRGQIRTSDDLDDFPGKRLNSYELLGTHRLALCLICALTGCGGSDDVRESATPVARRASASFEAPLSEQDVRTFLEIVRRLPAGKAPEFEPLASESIDDRLPAQALVSTYRREYRRLYDPVEQGSRWRRNSQLMAVLTAHGMESEAFAALMARLGCALAAGTINSRMNLSEAAEKADRLLDDLITRIDEWDERAAQGIVSSSNVAPRRQPLVDQLKDLVALSEFSRMLLNVPAESCAAVERHRQELAVHLQESKDVGFFERTLDAEAVIVPVRFEKPGPSPSP